MTTNETFLEMETRHVAEQEKRIARQKVLIACLRGTSSALSDEALVFLGVMEDLLEAMRAHLARLSK